MGTRRTALCLGLLLLSSGCASPQPAEPMATSVPAGGALAAAIGGLLWFVGRSYWRRIDRSADPDPSLDAPLRYPRATVVALLAPLLIAGASILAAGCWDVAVGYAEPHDALLSWEDSLVLTGIGAVVLTVLASIVGAIAVAVTSRRRSTRTWGRTALVVLVVGGGVLTHGVLLVWVPGLVLAFLAESSSVRAHPAGSTTFSRYEPRN